jgi:hypothetical protein
MARRRTITAFVLGGLIVAALFAFFASPHASSKPDGLSKVAIDKGFDSTERESATADSPLAGYAVKGVGDDSLATGLAGVIGVGLCFAVGAVAFIGIRALRGRQRLPAAPAAPNAATG